MEEQLKVVYVSNAVINLNQKMKKSKFYVGIPDKLLAPYLKGKKYIVCSDEGEAIAIGAGYWYATKKKPIVFMSADGFCNALNPITSFVIPEKIKMHIVVSVGRQEPQHKVMSDNLEKIIKMIQKYGTKGLSFEFIKAKS